MKWYKGIVKSAQARATLCHLAAFYIRLVRHTGKWQQKGTDLPRQMMAEGKPFIVAFWHQRLLMMPYTWQAVGGDAPFNMLISAHRDGEIISRTIGHFGVHTIAGSSSNGGANALRGILKSLKAGEVVGMTPDGPRGPRMHASGGVISAARISGVPIFPLTYSASRRRVMRSWDRFVLPFPFSRGVFAWGEPIYVPKDLDNDGMEAKRLELETSMVALTQKHDREFGLDVIEPAGPDEPVKQKRAAREAGETPR
ncbi:lysophospholipid acyltransferase family protein [Thalassospira marina]|uniref:DUF374 domain-containing protein n=1 Tax=Thalassospira marina TaxID=2048283 RepID=A0ABM6Q5R2_9PROT|nr:lysophospholipid acyltransferase family protein [Thalassospira marina]AUG51868.1 hypothetical protein CSC3H3_03405 [Thalassospira marina]